MPEHTLWHLAGVHACTVVLQYAMMEELLSVQHFSDRSHH